MPFESTKNGMSTKGTVTFVSVEDGAAKLHVVSDSMRDGKPNGHVDGIMLMDMSPAKVKSMDLTIVTSQGATSHMKMTLKAG